MGIPRHSLLGSEQPLGADHEALKDFWRQALRQVFMSDFMENSALLTVEPLQDAEEIGTRTQLKAPLDDPVV